MRRFILQRIYIGKLTSTVDSEKKGESTRKTIRDIEKEKKVGKKIASFIPEKKIQPPIIQPSLNKNNGIKIFTVKIKKHTYVYVYIYYFTHSS